MPRHGKKYEAGRQLVEPLERYALGDALGLMKRAAYAGFDESVDIAVRLGVNPRQADQMVRGACSLPFGTGKAVRVAVFAQGDAARAAEAAGAEFVGSDELIQKIQKEGWTDFDKAIATRSMMAKVGRIGRILGPRGLMPNPKTGTVVAPDDVARVVREVKGGRIDFRVERAGIVHASIGKVSMSEEQLEANILALVGQLVRLKPASAKGTYVRSVALSTTMGPGIRLDTNALVRQASDAR